MKLAYIYNIMKFVYWDSENINFCILGKNLFQDDLKNLSSKKVQEKDIAIFNSYNKDDLKSCNVLFISKSQKDSIDEILKFFSQKNILTISDIENFSKRGGMVELKVIDEKIKILVNLNAINNSNLKVSAKFLEVATILK